MKRNILQEMEEEVQILLMETNGKFTKEITDLCNKIDEEKEFIENE